MRTGYWIADIGIFQCTLIELILIKNFMMCEASFYCRCSKFSWSKRIYTRWFKI